MRGPPPKLSDYVPGLWSTVPPERAGVYLMRGADRHSWVAFWGENAWSPSAVARPTQQVEFFHLDGDVEGRPTRWDDERVEQIARGNGWRSVDHAPSPRTRK
jgi:hypothetical protein